MAKSTFLGKFNCLNFSVETAEHRGCIDVGLGSMTMA